MDQSISDEKLDDPLASFDKLWSISGLTLQILSFLGDHSDLMAARLASKQILCAVSHMGLQFVCRVCFKMPQASAMPPRLIITRDMLSFVRQQKLFLKNKQVVYVSHHEPIIKVTHFYSGFNNGELNHYYGPFKDKLEEKTKEAGLKEVSRTSWDHPTVTYEFDENGINQRVYREFLKHYVPGFVLLSSCSYS